MKLIFIHGRAQENQEEDLLKQKWVDALQRGLQKSGKTLPNVIAIEFPYYGDLLKRLTDEVTAAPMPQSPVKRGGSTTINESMQIDFYKEILGEIAEKMAETPAEKAAIKEMQVVRRGGATNLAAVKNLLIFLDKKGFFAETILKQFKDVYLYLKNVGIKQQINEVVLKKFDSTPCVVVGHSLGSIVSYLILKGNPHFQVKKFITLGSPLGVATVRKNLEGPLEMPTCIKDGWFNAFDNRDVVALNPLDKEYFNIQPPIENKNDVQNHTDDRHGIDGYLDNDVVANWIYDALIG